MIEPGDGVKAPWLCPRMRALELFKCTSSDPAILLRVVERRAAAAAPTETGATGFADYDSPGRLERLDISGDDCAMNDETFTAIKKLLGRGACWCRPSSSELEDGMDTDDE